MSPKEKITIEDVLKNVRFNLEFKKEALIRGAYAVAEKAHLGQKRKSGKDDYIQHPLHTALSLARIGLGAKTISAGLLHDVPEDTTVTLKDLEQKFGKEVSAIVDGVTKLGKIKLRGAREDAYLENLRKMFLAMASDIRVVLIKLADRLHNMETLEYLPPDKQQRIALETMEVFVPIANRLGIGEIKVRLEDLAFKYLDPKNYAETEKLVLDQYEQRKKYIDKMAVELKQELTREGINVLDIFGRTKHIHSLYQKLKRHDMDISKVYDMLGIRVIVLELANCYETLGIVHKKYRPLVGRIKDYISLPKPNGYKSIHTTIFGPEGILLEVQIRTKKMDDEAEYGIASHWIYSEKKANMKNLFFKSKNVVPKEELAWISQLRKWQKELGRNDTEFMEGLQIDFFKNHIFAFTPRGDVIDLPEDSTPIDFAYRIHSEVGNRANGAKANGKMVPLDYKIKNGEVIEILTTRDQKNPSRDWLRFVRTSLAKSHIKKYLKKEDLL